jgi:hypothetical protein
VELVPLNQKYHLNIFQGIYGMRFLRVSDVHFLLFWTRNCFPDNWINCHCNIIAAVRFNLPALLLSMVRSHKLCIW